MEVDRPLVEHIAFLSRLELDDEELAELEHDLGRIIAYVERLDEVDAEGVEPLSFVGEKDNVLRGDEPGESLDREDALRNAPERTAEGFKVPPVLGM